MARPRTRTKPAKPHVDPDAVKAAILDQLWATLLDSMMGYSGGESDVRQGDDPWPESFSDVVSLVHELVPDEEGVPLPNSNRSFKKRMVEIFKLDQVMGVDVHLRLTRLDVQKVLSEVRDSCLSEEAKASIKAALSTEPGGGRRP